MACIQVETFFIRYGITHEINCFMLYFMIPYTLLQLYFSNDNNNTLQYTARHLYIVTRTHEYRNKINSRITNIQNIVSQLTIKYVLNVWCPYKEAYQATVIL